MPAQPRGNPDETTAPLYRRLPRGPHRLDRVAVLRNQRSRIQGALIEAVAADGWERTSVTRVIGLAGVSRRAFYEQFANREDCLLATSELISERCLAVATAAADGADGPHARLYAIADALVRAVERAPAAAALAVCHTDASGRAGLACARRAAAGWERLLGPAPGSPQAGTAPPAPILRALVGGASAILRARLSCDSPVRPPASASALRSELLDWATPLAGGLPPGLAERIARASARSLRERARPARATDGSPAAHGARAADRSGVADRAAADGARAADGTSAGGSPHERLLRAALRLAIVGDFAEVTAAQVADEAAVPVDAFFAAFADPVSCYADAQARAGARALAVLEADQARGDWPAAARARIERLLGHLQQHPLCAHTLAHGAFAAGPAAVARNRALALAAAERVLDGAPGRPQPGPAATAGALWHTVGCQVAAGGVQLLPALRDHLAYVVVASVSGAEAATRAVQDGGR